jgi:NAD(P)-dependent dehydrogenase (short-subunit alcohol dehydrogenase family)
MEQSGGSARMNGKIVMVTGATAGIGKITAAELARMGATVIAVARDQWRGESGVNDIKAQSGSSDVHLLLGDFASQASIRKLAGDFKARWDKLHVLVNNAGMTAARRTVTVDGLETTFAVNHLGYFLLTNLLLDVLKASAPSRIVNVSSAAHKQGRLNFDDLQGEKAWGMWKSYSDSKLANILFTYELARRLEGTGVTVNALHPGVIPGTNLAREMPQTLVKVAEVLSKILFFGSSPEQGARTSVYLASSPDVAGVTGKYFIKSKEARSSKASHDAEAAARLWKVSEELTGLGSAS